MIPDTPIVVAPIEAENLAIGIEAKDAFNPESFFGTRNSPMLKAMNCQTIW